MSKVSKAKAAKPTAAKRRGAKYDMPEPVPNGEVLTDLTKKQWKIGHSIGKGGFGEIYVASEEPQKGKHTCVIKIEPKVNGPLFVEMHFFMKVCKENDISNWMKTKGLKFLGLPRFKGNGSHVLNGKQYRFIVMEKLGENLDSILKKYGNILHSPAVFKIALYILDALEYIHDKGYVHADIKGSNLLLGCNKDTEDKIYLVDFGLVSRYSNEFKPDPKCAHNGTIEYTSRDAHVGATTQRGDVEILAYNVLHWLTGKLPWLDNLKDCVSVHQKKVKYLDDIPALTKFCFGDKTVPKAVVEFLKYVCSVKPTESVNFEKCRTIFKDGLKEFGVPLNGKLDFAVVEKSTTKKVKGAKQSPRTKNVTPRGKKTKLQSSEESISEIENDNTKSPSTRVMRERKVVQNGKLYNDSIDSISSEESDGDFVYSPKSKKATKRKSTEGKVTHSKKKRNS